jgi:pyruvate/2-oxoglutarate dehydrogenase complex dihydrolipoamide acyltransferase (E2) component
LESYVMKLTDTQLRHIARTSNSPTGRGTASDRTDQVITDAASDNIKEHEPKIFDVLWAAERVLQAADSVIRATQEVAPGSQTAKTSSSFQNIGTGVREQGKFSLPMAIPRPKRAYRRPLVPSTASLLVLLVSAVVGASVLLIVERSRSWKVEASPSTLVTVSEPAGPNSSGASDRTLEQADAQTVAPSSAPRPEVPAANNARAADMGASRYAAPPANGGLSAAAPAAGALARPNGSSQAARGDGVPGNAGIAGNAVGPQAQNQRTGTGAARVATLAPRTGSAGATPQPLSPRQGVMTIGTTPGPGAPPARATSEKLAACLAARPAASRLSQDEIAKLFKRGEEYMGQGRISTARLLFQRAAEACDMKAAFALGATYDPIMLKKFGVTLLDPNIATARTWYEQARRLGLSEASHQLELLSALPQ